MTYPLPSEGPEKDIFLRALRDYSENCTPPALTPGCPFAIDIGPGRRGCGEECMDMLAEYKAPDPVDEIQLGKGLAIRPRLPRPRRGPTPRPRPFDAGELELVDRDRPPAEWRAASLLRALMDKLASPPPADEEGRTKRRDEIGHVLEELERRAFDIEALVRNVGPAMITGGVMVSVVAPMTMAASGQTPGEWTLLSPALRDKWGDLIFADDRAYDERLRLAADSGPDWARLAMTSAVTRVLQLGKCLSEAPISRIMDWVPPSKNELSETGGLLLPDPVQRWILDRFTTTYLDQWDLDSLLCEWDWLHGDRMAPCRPEEMACRTVDKGELAESIASASSPARGGTNRAVRLLTADVYVESALKMLTEGRRLAAAAIFEAVIAVAPYDVKARNNHGFCLLMDDPAQALRSLDTAAKLGMQVNSMNVGNRMFGLARLGRIATALDVAERFFRARAEDENPGGAYMWSYEGEPRVERVGATQLYVAELAEYVAREDGDSLLAQVWQERAAIIRAEQARTTGAP